MILVRSVDTDLCVILLLVFYFRRWYSSLNEFNLQPDFLRTLTKVRVFCLATKATGDRIKIVDSSAKCFSAMLKIGSTIHLKNLT